MVTNALGPPLEKKRLNAWFASLMTSTPIICRRDVNTGVKRALATLFLALLAMKKHLKADLHGTTMSHSRSYSCKSNLQLSYDCRVGLKSCRRPVISLLYATMSYRVNRPFEEICSSRLKTKKPQ